jgi:hypothetical protein
VASEFDHSREQGLARLDNGRALAPPDKIAHVALVYSPSEPLKPRLGSVADTLIRALLGHERYIGALGAIRLALQDAWAALHETKGGEGPSTLRPRDDQPIAAHRHRLAEALRGQRATPPPEPGPLGIFRALEDDMATYVARNDLRERVRGFVEQALLALTARDDICGVVLNTHSQGTVVSWDVLCRMPFSSWSGSQPRHENLLRAYVTAGSPIRKYVDLFSWGEQVGQLASTLDHGCSWHNFWDPRDPVADPLNPARAWRPQEPVQEDPPRDEGLLQSTDPKTGAQSHVTILDTSVDNIHNSSGGGLQAHDYWNNSSEFVAPLATLLRGAAEKCA